jgi:protein O-GlcNAc transferase
MNALASERLESETAGHEPSPHGVLLTQARASARSGDWARATQLYLDVLRDAPLELEALEGLGMAALRTDRPAEALEWLSRAERHAPDNPRVITNLGVAQGRNGQHEAALASYRRALELAPDDPRMLTNLARAERDTGDLDASIATFRRAIERAPESGEIWSMLSNVLRESGRLDEAIEAGRTATAKHPWLGDAHLNEGAALHLAGRVAEALVSYLVATTLPSARAVALRNIELARSAQSPASIDEDLDRLLARPNDAPRLYALARRVKQARPAVSILLFEWGLALSPDAQAAREAALVVWELGHITRAITRLVQAIELDDRHVGAFRTLGDWVARQDPNKHGDSGWKGLLERCPDDLPSLVNLGAAAQRRGYAVESVRLHRRAIGIDPRCIEAQLNLGSALSDQGLADEAAAVYRNALAVAPRSWPLYSNLLFTLHLDPTQSRQAIFDEHVAFGQRLAESASPVRAHANARDPERRLRIGYVSPDFRNHPVAHFIEPVLRAHDPAAVEVFCYSDVEFPDSVSERLATLVPHFSNCNGLNNAALRERVIADGIDILVDLAGHTARNRLPVFAERPSPVQVSWLGYFDTSGVAAIDYRIADAHSVTAADEAFFVEQVVRLPRTANCYLPPAPNEPAPAPCLRNGYVTFGCFNNPMKVGRDVVAAFGEILRRVPDSRLLFKYTAFNDPLRRARYLSWLGEEGIDESRILFEGPSALPQFFESFGKIDIALDPFPYSGETTALHTLWMGVPLVVLEGESLVQRLASRVLRICRREAWLARSTERYVQLAVELARDHEGLDRARAALRAELAASPLLDHAGVTRELEAAYRDMWRRWCRSGALDDGTCG